MRRVSATTLPTIFPRASTAFSLISSSLFFPTLTSSSDILSTQPHKILASSWLSPPGQSFGAIISDIIQKGGIRDMKS